MIARLLEPTVGATHATEMAVLALLLAVGAVGAVGVVTGVEVTDDDADVHPLLLYAATVNVYAVPFVSPVTWNEVADDPTSTGDVRPDGVGVTVTR